MTIISSRRANLNLNSGGGDKKQGLAPKATHFFKAPFTGSQYSTSSGDGTNRFKLVCINQLGGIGRGRSQFSVRADGANCPDCPDDLEKFKRYLVEINYHIQTKSLSIVVNDGSNNHINYKLCLVGNKEKFFTDISMINQPDYISISNEGFGSDSSNVIFTHLLSNPPVGNPIINPLSITYWDNNSEWKKTILNINSIQNKINFCNNYLRTIKSYLFTDKRILDRLGTHTLGLINNNIKFGTKDATTFLQDNGYGIASLFSIETPINNNKINIFAGQQPLTRPEILKFTDSNLYYNTILNQNFYDWNKVQIHSSTVTYTDISNLLYNLNEVILTSGITDICDNAFQNSGLTQITIPNSVKNIGSEAFAYCNNLTNVDISMTGSSLSTIGNYAFSDCVMLTHITIPNNVTNIGDNPFNYCTSLTTINISNDIFRLDGSRCLIDISNDNIISYLIASPDTSYSIPDTVITIGTAAFSSCNKLTQITIPNSVKNIGELAFYSCTSLNSITIPNSVTDISSYAFIYCNNLTNVIFGLSCEDISFGTDVFYGVNHYISFWYPISISGATLRTFQTNVIQTSDLSYSNFRPYITRSEILELSDYNLYYNTILNQNFYDWNKVQIHSSTVESSNISSFFLEFNEVILTSGITDICDNAFQNSTLTQITIPNNVINIGINPFTNCSKLTTINISNDIFSLDGSYCLIDISNDNIISYLIASPDTSYSIPDTVITIGDYAFSGSNYLTHITIPNSVKTIGSNAFQNCNRLTNVDISMTDSSLTIIGNGAFNDCNDLSQITIPNSVKILVRWRSHIVVI